MTLLIVIYIVFISLGLPDSLFGVSWPVVHLEFGIPESFASAYSIIIAVCTGGVSFAAGKMIRKFGTAKVTFFSTLLTAVGLLAISLSPNIAWMIICSVVLSYGAGAIDTGLNNYVSLHYKAKHMNWLHCFWGVGVTLSPMIMSAFLGGEAGQWRNGYRVIALIQLSIAMIVLATLRKWNTTSLEAASSDEKSEKKMLDLLRMKGVPTSILSLGLYCSSEFLIGVWGATYAVNTFALAPELAAKWVSLYYGGIMLGRMISGFLSEKAEDNTLIRWGVMAALSGMVVLMLPVGQLSLCGLLLIGLGFGPIFPSVIHSVPCRFGATYSADITGYHMGGAYTIGHIVQLTFGYVATAASFVIMPFVLFALCAGVLVANSITLKKLK